MVSGYQLVHINITKGIIRRVQNCPYRVFACIETAAILVHSLNRFSLLCTEIDIVAVALCCDIICKCSIAL